MNEMNGSSKAPEVELSWEDNLDWSTEAMPPTLRPVIFVAGSEYEMGLQYGKEASEIIRRNVSLVTSDALAFRKREEIITYLKKLEAIVKTETPELVQWWQGIADGAGIRYGDVVLVNLQLLFSFPPGCSTISVWGDASKDGKLIVGANADLPWNLSSYGVILIAHPNNGNSFMAIPQLAGQMGSNFVMNEKGLVCTFTAGQASRPEDNAFGYPDNVLALMYLAWKCDNTEQAKALYDKLNLYSGWITHLIDSERNACIIEHTSAVEVVRSPGNWGEKDYILATNHFLDGKMQPAHYESGQEDSYARYETEIKQISEGYGNHTVESIMDILGGHDYWDGKDWEKNVWSLDPNKNCIWTPEMRDWRLKSASRCIGVPEDRTAYILQGQVDRLSSFIPNATGHYCKLVLEKTARQVTLSALEEAKKALWQAASALSQGGKSTAEGEVKLNHAKSSVWQGINLLAKARICEGNSDLERIYFGQAATCFCTAQSFSSWAIEIATSKE